MLGQGTKEQADSRRQTRDADRLARQRGRNYLQFMTAFVERAQKAQEKRSIGLVLGRYALRGVGRVCCEPRILAPSNEGRRVLGMAIIEVR